MFDSLLDRLVAGHHAEDRRRPEPREAVAFAAELEVEGRRLSIEVGNVSAGGLMASFDASLAPGAAIAVHIGGQRLTGEVRWQQGGRFGVRFDTPLMLDDTMIEAFRPANREAAKQMSRWMI